MRNAAEHEPRQRGNEESHAISPVADADYFQRYGGRDGHVPLVIGMTVAVQPLVRKSFVGSRAALKDMRRQRP